MKKEAAKNVAVLGLGKSGISAALFLQAKGYTVWVSDDKQTKGPEATFFLSVQELANKISQQNAFFDFVVISPGIPLTHIVAGQAQKAQIEVICDVELAFRELAKTSVPIVGITGSNGKTTTTSLTCHLLTHCNIATQAVGNIGTPILSHESGSNQTLVVELSSFQLETMSTKVLDAACILNITPNHLDRHGTMSEYIKAKERIAGCLKPGCTLWVQKQFPLKMAKDQIRVCSFGFDESCDLYTNGVDIVYFGKKEATLPEELQNSRSHNVENFLSAYALARTYSADPELCRSSYSTFIKPKHRLEFVRVYNTISFYDDSKATSVDAVLRAVESLPSPIVLIAGGVHKGYPYKDWQKAFKNKVKACVLIGKAADIIQNDLENTVPILRAVTLQEAVRLAVSVAVANDAVLLSPGCASYDMFASFEDRGTQFQEIVHAIV